MHGGLPASGTLTVPVVVNETKESHEAGDAEEEDEDRVNVDTFPTSLRGHVMGSGPAQLIMDASRKGIGYCLVQIVEGHQLMLKTGSRSLSPAEDKYMMVQLEVLAVGWATDKCQAYSVDTDVTGSRSLWRILLVC